MFAEPMIRLVTRPRGASLPNRNGRRCQNAREPPHFQIVGPSPLRFLGCLPRLHEFAAPDQLRQLCQVISPPLVGTRQVFRFGLCHPEAYTDHATVYGPTSMVILLKIDRSRRIWLAP